MFDSFVLLVLAGISILFFQFINQKYQFFALRGIPYVKPTFLLGNGAAILLKKEDILQNIQKTYNAFPNAK